MPSCARGHVPERRRVRREGQRKRRRSIRPAWSGWAARSEATTPSTRARSRRTRSLATPCTEERPRRVPPPPDPARRPPAPIACGRSPAPRSGPMRCTDAVPSGVTTSCSTVAPGVPVEQLDGVDPMEVRGRPRSSRRSRWPCRPSARRVRASPRQVSRNHPPSGCGSNRRAVDRLVEAGEGRGARSAVREARRRRGRRSGRARRRRAGVTTVRSRWSRSTVPARTISATSTASLARAKNALNTARSEHDRIGSSSTLRTGPGGARLGVVVERVVGEEDVDGVRSHHSRTWPSRSRAARSSWDTVIGPGERRRRASSSRSTPMKTLTSMSLVPAGPRCSRRGRTRRRTRGRAGRPRAPRGAQHLAGDPSLIVGPASGRGGT